MKWITIVVLSVCLSAAAFAKPPVPRAANEFRFVDGSGKPELLSDYQGKVVLMQFLYTTCSHCQATARMLSKLQRELGSQGLQVLGVAFNPEAQQGRSALDEFSKINNVEFPVGAAAPEAVLGYLGISVMERFVVPQIVIVDRRGIVRAQSDFLGSPELQDEASLRTFLRDLLNKNGSRGTSSLDVGSAHAKSIK